MKLENVHWLRITDWLGQGVPSFGSDNKETVISYGKVWPIIIGLIIDGNEDGDRVGIGWGYDVNEDWMRELVTTSPKNISRHFLKLAPTTTSPYFCNLAPTTISLHFWNSSQLVFLQEVILTKACSWFINHFVAKWSWNKTRKWNGF